MANTPNMDLELPVPTTTTGPEWATAVNEAFEVVDEHDHSSGKGTPISPTGININADLEYNNNRAVEVKAVKMDSQLAALSGVLNTNSFHAVNGDAYFTNGDGTAIQLTSGGSISTPSSSSTPPGILFPYAGSSAPTGYLLCDGTAVSRTTYSALFAIVGTSFGAGDGSTTFNVPNMNGRVPMGAGTYTDPVSGSITRTFAANLGAEKHQLLESELATHDHPIFITQKYRSNDVGSNNATVCNGAEASDAPGNVLVPNIYANNAGDSVAHNNVQPSLVLNYIIKT
jgi:microcystin-dependent protein